MASDPTDLIREADGFLNGVPSGVPNVEAIALVRRLRDAIETSEFDRSVAQDASDRLLRDAAESRAAIRVIADYAGADADVKDILRCIRELAADHRALAEANATIERAQAVIESPAFWGHGTLVKAAIRRAIEGPAT